MELNGKPTLGSISSTKKRQDKTTGLYKTCSARPVDRFVLTSGLFDMM